VISGARSFPARVRSRRRPDWGSKSRPCPIFGSTTNAVTLALTQAELESHHQHQLMAIVERVLREVYRPSDLASNPRSHRYIASTSVCR
jgi:hypothetical protein